MPAELHLADWEEAALDVAWASVRNEACRDDAGRFASCGVEAVKDTETFKRYLGGAFNYDPGTGDRYLMDLAKELGYDRKPKVLSEALMDGVVADGALEMHRGQSALFQDQLRDGDYFAYPGVYGAGIYAGYGEDGGRSIGREYAAKTPGGVNLRMALAKDARIADFAQLTKEMSSEYLQALKGAEVHPVHKERLDELDKEIELAVRRRDVAAVDRLSVERVKLNREAYRAVNLLYSDEGRYAMSKGYDAIRVDEHNYVVVLNRSKLFVQEGRV